VITNSDLCILSASTIRHHRYFHDLLFLLVQARKSWKKRLKRVKRWKNYKFKKPGSVSSKASIFKAIKKSEKAIKSCNNAKSSTICGPH